MNGNCSNCGDNILHLFNVWELQEVFVEVVDLDDGDDDKKCWCHELDEQPSCIINLVGKEIHVWQKGWMWLFFVVILFDITLANIEMSVCYEDDDK